MVIVVIVAMMAIVALIIVSLAIVVIVVVVIVAAMMAIVAIIVMALAVIVAGHGAAMDPRLVGGRDPWSAIPITNQGQSLCRQLTGHSKPDSILMETRLLPADDSEKLEVQYYGLTKVIEEQSRSVRSPQTM